MIAIMIEKLEIEELGGIGLIIKYLVNNFCLNKKMTMFFLNYSSPIDRMNCYNNPNEWLDTNFNSSDFIYENIKRVIRVITFLIIIFVY